MSEPDNPGTGIIGKIIGPEPVDESEHFIICGACGQAVDCRRLGDVMHHEELGHRPLAVH